MSLIHTQTISLSVSVSHIHTHKFQYKTKTQNRSQLTWWYTRTSASKMLVTENDKHKHTEKYPHILPVAVSGGHYRQPYSITIFFQWTMQTLCNVGKFAVGCLLFVFFRSIHASQTEVESNLPNGLFIPVFSLSLSLSLSSFTYSCHSI